MRTIETGDDLLAEIVEQASKLNYESRNPNDLTNPVDSLDAWLEAQLQGHDKDKERLQQQLSDWLPTHDYYEADGQADDANDPELEESLKNTLQFFVEEDHYALSDPAFEYNFRAYLHIGDYSYPAAMIHRVVSEVTASPQATLHFLK